MNSSGSLNVAISESASCFYSNVELWCEKLCIEIENSHTHTLVGICHKILTYFHPKLREEAKKHVHMRDLEI